jgi:hypothetical protein
LFITLSLFEWIYRSYLIDFYRSELNALNSTEIPQVKKKTLLVFGDSFTASKHSYIDILRDSLTNTRVINSAIPGTSFLQHKLFFKDRIEEFKPNHILIQIYVGNDLIDYDHPVNWNKLSFMRNMYWWVSDSFISLQFINFRLGQFFSSSPTKDPKNDLKFNPETYNHREKIYFKANPLCLNNAVAGKENELFVINQLADDIESSLSDTETKCTILVIPHAAQVKKTYLKNMKTIGGSFNKDITKWKNFGFFHLLKKKLSHLKHVSVCTPLKKFQTTNENLYFLNDPHLNKKGNELLSNFLLKNLPS